MKKLKPFWSIYKLFFIFFFFSSSVFALSFDKIIVFGDSLSDTGNIYNLTTQAKKILPLIPIIPKNPPYFNGRFSNGPVWVDNLSKILNVPLINYAYGGAWVEPFFDSQQIIPFSLDTQVSMYLVANVTDFHKKDHLYVIWGGANDYVQNRSDAEYATTNTINHIQSEIDWLIFAGAKKFLILNLPDFTFVPQVAAQGPEFAAAVGHLSNLHNQKLAKMIEYEKKEHTDVTFINADVTQYFNDIIKSPEKYHLKNVTDACYAGGYFFRMNKVDNEDELKAAKEANIDIANSSALLLAYRNGILAEKGYPQLQCDNPDDYFYWDHLHPSKVVHQLMTTITLDLLSKG